MLTLLAHNCHCNICNTKGTYSQSSSYCNYCLHYQPLHCWFIDASSTAHDVNNMLTIPDVLSFTLLQTIQYAKYDELHEFKPPHKYMLE